MEDIITLYLFEVTRVGIGAGRALIGRKSLSSRVSTAYAFCHEGSGEKAALKRTFKTVEFERLLGTRNALAHGVFLGIDQANRRAFQTEHQDESMPDGMAMRVVHYSSADLQAAANDAEAMAKQFSEELGMTSLRDARQAPPLAIRPAQKRHK